MTQNIIQVKSDNARALMYVYILPENFVVLANVTKVAKLPARPIANIRGATTPYATRFALTIMSWLISMSSPVKSLLIPIIILKIMKCVPNLLPVLIEIVT